MLKLEIELLELKLEEQLDFGKMKLKYENKIRDVQVPTPEPLIIDLSNLDSYIKLEAMHAQGTVQCILNPGELLSKSETQDAWFLLEAVTSPTAISDNAATRTPSKSTDTLRLTVGSIHIVLRHLRQTLLPLARLGAEAPKALDQWSRCCYLENLVRTQQADLSGMEDQLESNSSLRKFLAAVQFHPDEYEEIDLSNMTAGSFNVTFPNNKEITSGDIEHVKTILVSLNKRLGAHNFQHEEIEALNTQLQDNQRARQELNLVVEEQSGQMEHSMAEQAKFYEHHITEKIAVQQQLTSCKQELEETERREKQLLWNLAEATSAMGELTMLKATIAERDREVASLTRLLDSQEKSRLEFQQKYQNALSIFEKRHQEDHEKYVEIDSSSRQLQLTIDKQSLEKDQLNREKWTLKSELENFKNRHEIQTATKVLAQAKIYEKLNLENFEAREDIKQAMQSIQDDFRVQYSKMQAKNEAALTEKGHLRLKIEELENQIVNLQTVNNELNNDKFQLNASLATVEQMLCVKFDEIADFHSKLNLLDLDNQARDQLAFELNFISDYLISESQRSLESRRLLGLVSNELKKKNDQIEKQANVLKAQKQYQPVDEPIDQALADFLKTHSLDVAITRNGTGQYTFGSHRISLELDKGILFVIIEGEKLPFTSLIESQQDSSFSKENTNRVRFENEFRSSFPLISRFRSTYRRTETRQRALSLQTKTRNYSRKLQS